MIGMLPPGMSAVTGTIGSIGTLRDSKRSLPLIQVNASSAKATMRYSAPNV
jgi:hypothetical protein